MVRGLTIAMGINMSCSSRDVFLVGLGCKALTKFNQLKMEIFTYSLFFFLNEFYLNFIMGRIM